MASQNTHLEDDAFPGKHTTANICDGLLNACADFGIWSKNRESRIPQSEEAMGSDKLVYLATKRFLDAPVLMSDCGIDVSVGAEKDNLLDCNHCAYRCLSINIAIGYYESSYEKCSH